MEASWNKIGRPSPPSRLRNGDVRFDHRGDESTRGVSGGMVQVECHHLIQVEQWHPCDSGVGTSNPVVDYM